MYQVPIAPVSAGGTRLERVLNLLSLFTMAMTVPQVVAVWTQQNAGGVSLISWSAYLLAAVVWLFHGLQKRDPAIYLACIGWIILDAAIVMGVVVHR